MNNLIPLKSLGQNFLTDKNIIRKVVDVAEIKSNEVILEVGPGRGALTFELAKRAKKVIAIEKDKGLVLELQEKIKDSDIENVEIIHGDAMKLPTYAIEVDKVVSNPPYEIAARLLINFLALDNPPSRIVFVVQKEIARRATGKSSDANILSNIVQAFGVLEIVANIPRQCFSPQPRVDSAILSISPFKDIDFNKKDFIRIVRAGFSSKRKFLISNLVEKLEIDKENLRAIFSELKLDEKIRAERLITKEWIELTKFLIQL